MATEPIGISFPKSGRTWLKAMLGPAGAPIVFTHAGHGSRKEELGRPFERVPDTFRDRPVLFLHRNPIDTAVSFFHQVTKRDFAPGTLKFYQRVVPLWLGGRLPPRDVDAFVLHPGYGVEAVCRFNRGWLDHLAGRTDCRIVTYEALRADPVAGLSDVIRFVGKEPQGIETVVERASFEKMRARDEAVPPRPFAFLRPDRSDPNARKVRRGKVGGYADELRPETVAAARAIAARYGFEA